MGSLPKYTTDSVRQVIPGSDEYLLSEDSVSFTDILSEGRIEGVIDEKGNVLPNSVLGKGVYFDEIPVQNEQGVPNYKNIVITNEYGSADIFQTPDFSIKPSNFKFINKELEFAQPFEFDITESDASSVTITIELSQLYRDSGRLGHKIAVKIWIKRLTPGAETPYDLAIDEGFMGRVLSPYRKSYTLPLSKSVFNSRDKWRVRVQKIPASHLLSEENGYNDPENLAIRHGVRVNSYFWSYSDAFTYPTSAVCNSTFSSESLQNLPRRNFRAKGIRVRVPNNYSPEHGKSYGFYAEFYVGTGFDYSLGTGIHSFIDYDFEKDCPTLRNFESGFSARFSGYLKPDRNPFPVALTVGTMSGSFYIDSGAGFEQRLESEGGDIETSLDILPNEYYPFKIEMQSKRPKPIDSSFSFYYTDESDYIDTIGGKTARIIENKIFSLDNTSEKSYNGIWNGGWFKHKIYSNNPAWIFYDMQSSKRHGLGKYIDQNYIDKWGLYEISQYCDELVFIPEVANLFLSGFGSLNDPYIKVKPLESSIKSGTRIKFVHSSGSPYAPVDIIVTGDAYAGSTGILIEPLDSDYEPYVESSFNGYGNFIFPPEKLRFSITGNNLVGAYKLLVTGVDLAVKSGSRLLTNNIEGAYEVYLTGDTASGDTSLFVKPLPADLSSIAPSAPSVSLQTINHDVNFGTYTDLFAGQLLIIYNNISTDPYYSYLANGFQIFNISAPQILPAADVDFQIIISSNFASEVSDLSTAEYYFVTNEGNLLSFYDLSFISYSSKVFTFRHYSSYEGDLVPPYNGQKIGPKLGQGVFDIDKTFYITGGPTSMSNVHPFGIQPINYSIYSGLPITVGAQNWAGNVSGNYGIGAYEFSGSFDEAVIGSEIDTYEPTYGTYGYGSYQAAEPRFRFNAYIQDYSDAYEAIQSFTSVFRAFSYWGDARIISIQDKKESFVNVFSNANVVDGEFSYSNTSRSSRYNRLKVRWSNPNNFYKTDIVQVEDPKGIIKYGIREKEINAFGCTSKHQAARLGKYILETENNLTEVINFKAGAEANIIFPGAVIKVYDYKKFQTWMAGRILDGSLNGVTGQDESSFFVKIDRKLELAKSFEPRQYFSGEFFASGDSSPYSFFRCRENHNGTYDNVGAPYYWEKFCVSGSASGWNVGDVAYTGTGPSDVFFYLCTQSNINEPLTNTSYWTYTGRSVDRFKFYHMSPTQILRVSGITGSHEHQTGSNPSQVAQARNIIAPWSHLNDSQTVYLNAFYTGAGQLAPSGSPNIRSFMWFVESSESPLPEQYRVLAISEEENGVSDITAIQYDPELFDRIDNIRINV